VEILLTHPNIDINTNNNNGTTALMYLVGYGFIDHTLVEILLTHPNIDLDKKDKD